MLLLLQLLLLHQSLLLLGLLGCDLVLGHPLGPPCSDCWAEGMDGRQRGAPGSRPQHRWRPDQARAGRGRHPGRVPARAGLGAGRPRLGRQGHVGDLVPVPDRTLVLVRHDESSVLDLPHQSLLNIGAGVWNRSGGHLKLLWRIVGSKVAGSGHINR